MAKNIMIKIEDTTELLMEIVTLNGVLTALIADKNITIELPHLNKILDQIK